MPGYTLFARAFDELALLTFVELPDDAPFFAEAMARHGGTGDRPRKKATRRPRAKIPRRRDTPRGGRPGCRRGGPEHMGPRLTSEALADAAESMLRGRAKRSGGD